MNIKDYKEIHKNDKQNRRRFLKKLVKCTVFIPPIIYQLKTSKTSHAALPPKGLDEIKGQEFYDEILKTAYERMVGYT